MGQELRGDLEIIDGHLHVFGRDYCDRLLADLEYTEIGQFAVQVTGRDRIDPEAKQFRTALWLKQSMPRRVFLFGGLDFTDLLSGAPAPRVPLLEQIQRLRELGCDGLKLLTGKPDYRKAVGHPLDGELFEPMLVWAEQTQFPILWHVGDPPEFWSEHTVPPWARTRGWWYDASTPPKWQIDQEIARVFERHPRLNLILPHFFFLSTNLNEAARLLDDHPSYSLDLAPGVEMYHNFTANHAAARAFFIRYADRILFGTDFGMTCGWSRDRGRMIRQFLETDDHVAVPDDPAMSPDDRPPLHGLALPPDALKQIYAENFRRKVGPCPKPLAANAQARLDRWFS